MKLDIVLTWHFRGIPLLAISKKFASVKSNHFLLTSAEATHVQKPNIKFVREVCSMYAMFKEILKNVQIIKHNVNPTQ